MTVQREGRVLLSLGGMDTQQWQRLFSAAGREVVTRPPRPGDPDIDYGAGVRRA